MRTVGRKCLTHPDPAGKLPSIEVKGLASLLNVTFNNERIKMTETVAEPTNTEGGPSQVEEKPNFPDEMAQASFNMLADLINKRNAKVGEINAVKGDRQTLTEQIEANSDKPEIVAARAERDRIQEQLDEAIMALHAVVTPEVNAILADAESSVKETEEAVKAYDDKIKPGTTYFKKMYGENLAKFLPGLARLKGFSTKGAGSSGRRVRGFTVVTVIDGEQHQHENFASAAKYLDLETAELQEAFFKAAGKDNLKEIADRVDFTVEYQEVPEGGTEPETFTAQVVAFREQKDETDTDGSDESDETASE